MSRQREDSLDYVHVPLVKMPASFDPLTATYAMAFVEKHTTAVPSSGTGPDHWTAAVYDAALGTVKILVGPGALVVPPGNWVVLVKVTSNPEIPVQWAAARHQILDVA